jgi:hypothetical protein
MLKAHSFNLSLITIPYGVVEWWQRKEIKRSEWERGEK